MRSLSHLRTRKSRGLAASAAPALATLLLLTAIATPHAEGKKEEKSSDRKLPEHELKPVLVEPGAYEINVSSETADGATSGASIKETHCLVEKAGAANHGFAALNPDSPLRNCPTTDLRETGDSLSFEIRCTNGNPARGHAYYTVFGTRFHGRIDVTPGDGTAGGAEIQDGRRIASCPAP